MAKTLADLRLDLRGTPFQRLVWQALREIPRGRTETYAEVAARIGHPRAARAVARACAANPVALLVPCHRVVPKARGRADVPKACGRAGVPKARGHAGGWRWGPARKRDLLVREGAL